MFYSFNSSECIVWEHMLSRPLRKQRQSNACLVLRVAFLSLAPALPTSREKSSVTDREAQNIRISPFGNRYPYPYCMKGPCGDEIFVSEGYENDHASDFLTSDDSVLEGGKRNDSLARPVSRGIDSRELSWSISVLNKTDHPHSTKE